MRRDPAELRDAVRDDGCFNIWVASYVLTTRLKQADGDVWEAAGLYNSATPVFKHAYQLKLEVSYRRLFGPGRGRRRAN